MRHRLHGDQRCAGRRDVTAMLSLGALEADGGVDWLVDPDAEPGTEQGAADSLAILAAERLVSDWAERRRSGLLLVHRADRDRIEARVAAEQALVRNQMKVNGAVERLRESDRHVVRRAPADMVRHAAVRKLN